MKPVAWWSVAWPHRMLKINFVLPHFSQAMTKLSSWNLTSSIESLLTVSWQFVQPVLALSCGCWCSLRKSWRSGHSSGILHVVNSNYILSWFVKFDVSNRISQAHFLATADRLLASSVTELISNLHIFLGTPQQSSPVSTLQELKKFEMWLFIAVHRLVILVMRLNNPVTPFVGTLGALRLMSSDAKWMLNKHRCPMFTRYLQLWRPK